MAEPDEAEVHEGSPEHPISLEEDRDVPQSAVGVQVRYIVDRVQNLDVLPIKAEEDEEGLSEDRWAEDEADYDRANEAIEAIDLTEDSEPEPEPEKVPVGTGRCKHWRKGVRNPCLCGTHYTAPEASTTDVDFKISQFVELKEPAIVGRFQAEFLEVWQIFHPHTKGKALVRGFPYARTRNLDGRIDARKNEVCALLEFDTNDDRPVKSEQALVEVALEDIKKVRILHRTNKLFPECRFDPCRYPTKEDRETKAPLTCRWVLTRYYPDARYRRAQRPVDGEELRHFNESDVTKDRHRASDAERLTTWRRGCEKVPGGSFVPKSAQKADFEPVADIFATSTLPGQKYSVVDVFCGAGGFSKGAEMAGFKVSVACDHWSRCCETYRENFPDTDLHEKDVYDFIMDTSTDLTVELEPVDFVHLSPPCQFYSPAHTCTGKNDMANIATLFACEHIINVFRPRMFSLEQTFGLSQERYSPYFNALIQGFTRYGYSIKWKVFHLVGYGLPQTRKRLFMMGAAPGETLPEWPEPTHSKEPTGKQKPLVSAVQACSRLVEGWNLHNINHDSTVDRIPWDGNKPLERTITTSGGQCYHWSGRRELTLAEFAALQGFPPDFRFRSAYIKKQIGNAFPPVVVKAFMKHIRKHLEKVDGIDRLPDPASVIDLGDDDDNDGYDHKPYRWIKREGNYDNDEALARAIHESQMPSQLPQSNNLLPKEEAMPAVIYEIREVLTQSGPGWYSSSTTITRHSVTYMGESSCPGSTPNRPITIEDSEAETGPDRGAGPSTRRSSHGAGPSVVPHNSPNQGVRSHSHEDAFASPGSAAPRVPFEMPYGGDNPAVWNKYNGELDERDALQAAIGASVRESLSRLEVQETAEPVDDITPADDLVYHEGKGKGKAVAVVGNGAGDGYGYTVHHATGSRTDALEAPADEDEENEQLRLAIAKSLDDQERDHDDSGAQGKGKENIRTFQEFDAGQDNSSLIGREGGTKHSRGDE
ncbi:hypothetical protein VPNG_03600 [Cytospora leucostoma]|uniref:DNA (cytosine-5-)-methyltransferase n=1 Tax=Cytospora leucostoma TaxID=1230097 RepID=A0A423XCQ1_9PEZI|nr:hypothetical protein VPNG_03600 [Cytospora leucostoma]